MDPLAPRLLGRAGFGWSLSARTELDRLGWDGWIQAQLDSVAIPDPGGDAWCARSPNHALDGAAILRSFEAPVRDLRELALARAVASSRQVRERVVEMWNDAFHVDQEHGECRILKTIQDRTAIREHALGRFRDLLGAVARSGAMLEYLDNRSNVAAAPNENFARELLELHTLGVGNYGEDDVRETARCFTGWTMLPRTDPRWGEFEFRAEAHDYRAKAVLGLAIDAGGGIADGERVLDLLARHPATARRVAERIASRFLGENAPPDAVAEAEKTYTRSDGDVRAVLSAVLRREHFAAAEARGSRRYLRPFELAAALVRATSARVEDFGGLLDEIAALGHAPFAWPAPDGYPDGRAHWEAAFAARCALCERFFGGDIPGVSSTTPSLECASTPKEFVRNLDGTLTGGRLSEAELDVLARRARDLWPLDDLRSRRIWALAACAPGFWEV